jgi:hypothetical protein
MGHLWDIYGTSMGNIYTSAKYKHICKLCTYVVQIVVQMVVQMVVQSMPFVFHVSSWQPTGGALGGNWRDRETVKKRGWNRRGIGLTRGVTPTVSDCERCIRLAATDGFGLIGRSEPTGSG